MADKQIGIRLDVKSTGLQDVDDSLSSVSKSLNDIGGKISGQNVKGWGSESHTKELREQLRYMQQLMQVTERMARLGQTPGNVPSSPGGGGGGGADGAGGGTTYSNPLTNWIGRRFGNGAASSFQRGMTYAGRIGGGLVAFDVLSTLRSGISNGTQLAYGYGDLAKRMDPAANALQYGLNLSNGLQGYGYSDTAIMQGATAYGGATGRMGTGQFQSQMLSMLQTGRRFGLDLAPVVQNFAGMFSGGVTGGSQQQLSAQEYANLVANAVNRGNMQGREATLMSQLTQVVQMGVNQSGQAGDIRQLGGLFGLIDRSGNQGLISNAGTVTQGLNNMITNPGGGYAGQAMIMQALTRSNPGMGYFQLQDLASQGISGKGNLKSVMSYVTSLTKNKDQMAYMMSMMGGGNQHLLRQFLDTAINPDGSFNQQAIEDFAKSATNAPPAVPQNNVDDARNRTQSKDHAANNAGIETLTGRSYLDAIQGSILNHFGAPLVYGAEGVAAGSAAYGAYRVGRGIFRFGRGLFGAGGAAGASGAASSSAAAAGAAETGMVSAGAAGAAGADASGLLPFLGNVVAPLFAGMWTANGIHNDNKKIMDAFSKSSGPGDFLKRVFSSSSSSPAASSTSAPAASATDGATLAPIVASTIMALAPYMSQLKPYLAVDNTSNRPSASNDLVYRGNGFSPNDLVYRGGNGGLRLASASMSAGGVMPRRTVMVSSGSSSAFVQNMLPYAQQAAEKTGLPVEFILGQWGHESGWGTSTAAQQDLNFAGIKPWSGASAGPDQTYAGYSSLSDFANGYSDFLTKNKRYKSLLDAAKNGASDDQLANIMGSSGYAEDPSYTSKLQGAIGSVQRQLMVKGEVTVNVKQPDGTITRVKAPMTAAWTGLTST